MLIRKEEPLNVVRSLSYETKMYLDATEEKISFLGPNLKAGTEISEKAEIRALLNFINYYKYQINDVKDYLANDCNNNCSTWKSHFNPLYWITRLRIWLWTRREHRDNIKGIPIKDININKWI